MGHRPQVRRSLAVVSIQNELDNANEVGLTELTPGQVWSPKVDSLDSRDSIDSIESPDSLDSLDSLRPTMKWFDCLDTLDGLWTPLLSLVYYKR